MTAIELARQVKATWAAQERCLDKPTSANIREFQRLERELDKMLDEILADRPAEVNMMGFDPE